MFEYKLTVLNELQLAVLGIAVGGENLISSIQIPRVFTTIQIPRVFTSMQIPRVFTSIQIPRVFTTIKHAALGVLIVKQGIRMMNIWSTTKKEHQLRKEYCRQKIEWKKKKSVLTKKNDNGVFYKLIRQQCGILAPLNDKLDVRWSDLTFYLMDGDSILSI